MGRVAPELTVERLKMIGQKGNIMKKYKATHAPKTTRTELLGAHGTVDQLLDVRADRDRLTGELERVKRERDEYRDMGIRAIEEGLSMLNLQQSTRAELVRERRAHAAELARLNADVAFFKKALARALEHLDGSVMVTDDAPVDRLALDETIDGDMLVRLERPVRK